MRASRGPDMALRFGLRRKKTSKNKYYRCENDERQGKGEDRTGSPWRRCSSRAGAGGVLSFYDIRHFANSYHSRKDDAREDVMSLVLNSISHRYGEISAVDAASLEVAGGEIVCLFGASGCGKTTLLRVAAGLERLQSGTVSLDGDLLAGPGKDIPSERRPIGFVFQDYVLFPHLTALRNVEFGLTREPFHRRRALAREELARVGLADLSHRYPHELSGGQQQRAALARAFARRPRAMFLDEPFASIDAVLRRRLREDVRRILKEAGAATILVTHDAEEALAIGDRVAVMRGGRIIEAATPQSLYEMPATPEAAMLFSGAQRLEGFAAGGTARTVLGELPIPIEYDGEVVIVFLKGGVRLNSDPEGAGRVVESRFVGPGWTIYLAGPDSPNLLAFDNLRPLDVGERVSLDPDPERLRVFSAEG